MYAAWFHQESGQTLIGIFSTAEKANAAIIKCVRDCYQHFTSVDEIALDEDAGYIQADSDYD